VPVQEPAAAAFRADEVVPMTAPIWTLVIQVVVGASTLFLLWSYLPVFWGAPFVPSSFGTAGKMLRMADVKPGELVVDLGAGDGRVVILAALRFGARAIGVEIDPLRCVLANALIAIMGLRGRAKVVHGDMYRFDVSQADVVVVYLLQGTNQRLRDRLGSRLRAGSRVVSHSFSMSGWSPMALDDRRGIFLYEIGNTGQDVWTRFV
jgi:SAM-dependent methyltransferase